jgi:hypothetical protein
MNRKTNKTMKMMTNRKPKMMWATLGLKIKMNPLKMKITSPLKKAKLSKGHQIRRDRRKRRRKIRMNKVILVIMPESCLPLMNEYRISP